MVLSKEEMAVNDNIEDKKAIADDHDGSEEEEEATADNNGIEEKM